MADQTATATNTLEHIITNEAGQKDFNRRLIIPFSDINNALFTTQGDTVIVNIGSSGANFIVAKSAVVVTTAFATTGTLTVNVGTDGDPNNFQSLQDVKTAGVKVDAIGAAPLTLTGSFGASSDELQIQFITQGGTGAPSDITAGELEVLLQVINI